MGSRSQVVSCPSRQGFVPVRSEHTPQLKDLTAVGKPNEGRKTADLPALFLFFYLSREVREDGVLSMNHEYSSIISILLQSSTRLLYFRV